MVGGCAATPGRGRGVFLWGLFPGWRSMLAYPGLIALTAPRSGWMALTPRNVTNAFRARLWRLGLLLSLGFSLYPPCGGVAALNLKKKAQELMASLVVPATFCQISV